jgi:Domain of unknown function (DUF4194)
MTQPAASDGGATAPRAEASSAAAPLSVAAIALLKGVVHRDSQEGVWLHVLRLQNQLRDHMAVLGLGLVIDESEGYAYLRSVPEDPDQPLPRLVPRHRLSYHVSLQLALLRKAIAEFDATSGEGRLVVTRDRLIDDLRTFLPETAHEVRLIDQIDRTIAKVVDLGFLRPMPTTPPTWEVRRIIKAFVDAEWVGEFDAKLAEYAAHAGGSEG